MSNNSTKGKYDIVVLVGDILAATAKATLMLIEEEKVWLPNSQFKKPSIQDKYKPERWTLFIPRWLAEDKELEYMEEDDWTDMQEED